MTTYRLGINTCFAVKRWPRPERWAALVRDELGLDLVQHCLDLVDLDSPPDQAIDEAERLRAACAAVGLTLHSTFTGLAAYSSNLLLHPDPAARERARAWYRRAIDFTRLAPSFEENGTAVLGVSADPTRAQEAFRNKHQLAVPLASDEQHAMLEAYGVWGEKSMYGRTFLGITRTTVLIGPDSRVVRIWRNVKVDGHADEVLEAAQSV